MAVGEQKEQALPHHMAQAGDEDQDLLVVAALAERVNDFAPPMIKNLLRKAVVISG